MVTDNTHDRAQVILIGAIVIAFVLLGVVVVLNGLVYTEEVSSSSTTQSAGDAETSHIEKTSNIESIVNESYDENYNISNPGSVENDIEAYLTSRNTLQSNISPSTTTIKNVEVVYEDEGIPRAYGTDLGPGGGVGTDNHITIEGGQVFLFTYEVGGDDDEITLEIQLEGEYLEIVVDQSDFESDDEITITETVTGEQEDYEDEQITIDFLAGEVNGEESDVLPDLLSNRDGIDQIDFRGDNANDDVGLYEIIGHDVDVPDNPNLEEVDGSVDYVELSYRYDSSQTSITKTTRITGFGEV